MTSRTERILIIDSDERARSELGRYLEARGFYVTGYSDLASARSLFDDNIPDIIFADLSPDAIGELAGRLEDAETFGTLMERCSDVAKRANRSTRLTQEE